MNKKISRLLKECAGSDEKYKEIKKKYKQLGKNGKAMCTRLLREMLERDKLA